MNLRGYLFILVAAALWGIIGPISRLAFTENISPMEVAFWRAVLTWGFFGIHAVIKKETGIEKKDYGLIFLFGITGVTLFYGSYQIAVNTGGAALAAVLLYTAPAWVAVMSRIFFKERMTPSKLIALALTITGVIGVSMGAGGVTFHITPTAILSGLLAGFCYALYYIFGKHFSGSYSSPNIFLYILPIGALTLYPWVDFTHKSLTAWGALLCLAFLSTYGAYYCYYLGLKYLEPTRAAITATLEPVIAAIVAYFWWNEYFSTIGYIGSAMILASVFLMIFDGIKTSRKAGDK